MDLLDVYKYLIGGYYGVSLIDEYDLKVYVLKDIEKYINDWLESNDLGDVNIEEINNEVNNLDEVEKLQDAMLVLHQIDGPLDLILIINQRIMKLNEKDWIN